eukprot:jgi/Astpho2/159/Aster-04622
MTTNDFELDDEEGLVEEIDDEYDSEEEDVDEADDGSEEEEDEDEDEEEQSEEDIEEDAPANGRGGAPQDPPSSPWSTLANFPASTQRDLQDAVHDMKKQGLSGVNVLVLGKTGVGKSALTNRVFGETVAQTTVFQFQVTRPLVVRRHSADFNFAWIDSPPASSRAAANEEASALRSVVPYLQGRPLHAVLFVERLDEYRVDSVDHQVMEAISRTFGDSIWDHTMLVLTHGMVQPPDGVKYDDLIKSRANALRHAIRKAGADRDAQLRHVVVENHSRCKRNDEGELVLGNGKRWLVDLMEGIADMAVSGTPYIYSKKQAARATPNKRKRWLIPVLLAGQILLKMVVLDRIMDIDGCSGDVWGPYSKKARDVFLQRRKEKKERQKADKKKKAEKASRRRK